MDDSGSPRKNQHFSQKIKAFFNGKGKPLSDVTEEEIISMVHEGHEQGVLQAQEVEMIHNIFEFGDKEAKDIMTPRINMIALDGELSYTDMVSYLIETGRSRYPVYLEDVDHIIGVLHIKDAFAFSKRNELFRTSVKDIPGLLREAEFIPETMNINTLFSKMQSKKNHLVIVVDEYGQTSGIVAMEDILEEIVGNIEDEHDVEEQQITEESDGSIRVDGMTAFSEIVEMLQLPMEEDAFETLNGYLISLLGRIPAEGETAQVQAHGYLFDIQEVEDKVIRAVVIQLAPDIKE
jgi:putative hemolysin